MTFLSCTFPFAKSHWLPPLQNVTEVVWERYRSTMYRNRWLTARNRNKSCTESDEKICAWISMGIFSKNRCEHNNDFLLQGDPVQSANGSLTYFRLRCFILARNACKTWARSTVARLDARSSPFHQWTLEIKYGRVFTMKRVDQWFPIELFAHAPSANSSGINH